MTPTTPASDRHATTAPLGRRSLLAGLGLLPVGALAACSRGGTDDASDAGGSDAGGASGTRTVTDATGAEVEIPARAERVVSLHYAATQAAMDLGLTPIGTGPAGQGGGGDEEEWVPAELWAELKDVPIVVSQQEPQIEKIAELEPDLILATNVTEEDVRQQLEQIAPVYGFVLRGGQRKDWQGRVEGVGEALGRQEEFAQLKADWAQELDDAAAEYADVAQGLVVGVVASYEEGNLYAWGEDNMQGTILLPLGVTWSAQENAAVEGEKEAEKTISNEQIIDVVGDAEMLFYDSTLSGAATAFTTALRESPLYQQLPAVAAGHEYPFGKNTIAGYSDARASLAKITEAFDAYRGA